MSIYRYGVSMLSRDKHTEALHEEVMIDKTTGQVLIKLQDSDKVVSYDSQTREQNTINHIKNICDGRLIQDDISMVVLENKTLPIAIDSTNIIEHEAIDIDLYNTFKMYLDVSISDKENEVPIVQQAFDELTGVVTVVEYQDGVAAVSSKFNFKFKLGEIIDFSLEELNPDNLDVAISSITLDLSKHDAILHGIYIITTDKEGDE